MVAAGQQRTKRGPTVFAFLSLGLSLLLALIFRNSLIFDIVGYLLTPFAVVLCLAKARSNDLVASARDWSYDRGLGAKQIKLLQVLTGASFLLAVVHIWRIATEVASR